MPGGSARFQALAAVLAWLVGVATPAAGTIIGGDVLTGGAGATFIKLTVPFDESTPPNTVGANTFQSVHLFGFDEDQNIVLSDPLTVNFVPNGPTILPAGTTVASHYIFFDPVSGNIDATVDFDSDIVAIITSTMLLSASDFLANTGVTYLNPGFRGLEAGDSVTISGARQIRFDTSASSPGDYVRVLTEFSRGAEIPEAGSAALFCAGLGLIVIGSWLGKLQHFPRKLR
jgi:hypothetical protein